MVGMLVGSTVDGAGGSGVSDGVGLDVGLAATLVCVRYENAVANADVATALLSGVGVEPAPVAEQALRMSKTKIETILPCFITNFYSLNREPFRV
jgi:hypothetical protein